jgi:hypothetical protein
MRTHRKASDEARIAEEIMSVLPEGIARACSPEKHNIRYTLRADGMKLRTIVFSRASLRRLMDDPNRTVKVEYLQRDLLASATRRTEFRYPRLHVHVPSFPRKFAFGLPMASMV